MKFSIGRRQAYYLVAFVLVAVLVGVVYYKASSPREIKQYDFYGTEFVFRDDLLKAKNISIYPDEVSLFKEVWNPDVYRVKLVYVPTKEPSAENGMLAANIFELRFKLDLAYNKFEWGNEFTTSELETFENISYANDTLVIALVRPSLADRTAVELHDNIVYIKGMTAEDLDRATIRFLMAAMNITL